MNTSTQIAPSHATNYQASRLNALGHGILSQAVVLPWETRSEYDELLNSLAAEHRPAGATEWHLVEEIAGIMWRKRRLRLAEASAHRRGLYRAHEMQNYTVASALAHIRPTKILETVKETLTTSEEDTQAEIKDLIEDIELTEKAIQILEAGGKAAFKEALAIVRPDTREWFESYVKGATAPEDHYQYEANAEDLTRFLETEALTWLQSRKAGAENRPLIREQAFGDSLNVAALEKLARYEVHLDRKLEKMLGMLYRLKDIAAATAQSVSQNTADGG